MLLNFWGIKRAEVFVCSPKTLSALKEERYMNILIIVDMQRGFVNKNNDKFDKIIATKFVNKQASQYVKFLNYHDMCGDDLCDFILQLPSSANVVEKTSYGLPLEFLNDIKKAKNDTFHSGDVIYLCGTDYDACVLAIAYQLFDLGFKVNVISDCVGSSSSKPIDKNVLDRIVIRNLGKMCLIESKNI